MPDAMHRLSATQILQLYQRKELSPVDVLKETFKQVLKYNPGLNAFVLLDEKQAMHQARSAEKRWVKGTPKGMLDGIPVTIKDWFHHKGWPTRYGSTLSSTLPQAEDSPPVARLKEEGAIIIGKTTLPEYGHKGVTDSPLSGITRNPWDMTKTSGGSSGGAAVAAATGMGLLHLGSDAGGSIRIPTSFCGVVGFKPSPGIVPAYPPSLFSTLSATGPIVQSVEDAALMMDVISKPDTRDWHALPYEARHFIAALKKPLPKLKIAFALEINHIAPQKEIVDGVQALLPLFQAIGTVDHISLHAPNLIEVFNDHWAAVASHMGREWKAAERKKLDPRLQHWIKKGDGMRLHDYLWAERERMNIGGYFKDLLETYDVLIMPTTAMAAFDAGVNMPTARDGSPWDDWTPFTYPANLAKLPAISIPAGMTAAGLPIGLQIMGGFSKDALVLQTAALLEKEIGFKSWHDRDEQRINL